MRAEVRRQDLSKALAQIARIVETRSTIPILNNVLLGIADGVLTLRGTDLATEITCTVVVTGDDGHACVPAKALADIVKRMVGDTVTLDMEEGQSGTGILIIKSGRSRFKLPSMASTSFPTLAVDKYDCSFTADLSRLFAPVAFAVGESNHANTDGLYLHVADGRLRAVGTNTHRMAVYDIELPSGAEDLAGAIIPAKVAALVPKGDLALRFCRDRMLVTTEDTTICAKLFEGDYVPYQRAIPNNDRVLKINKPELAAASARVGLVAAEVAGKPVRLNIAPGSIQLVASDRDGSEAVDEIAIDYHGEPTYLAFNCRYLDEMLAAAPGDEIEFAITDNTTHTLVRSLSDAAFIGVLSPYRM